MSELKIYVNTQFGNIRAIQENDKAWFVGLDVTKALGYRNGRKAILDHVKANHKIDGVVIRDTIGRNKKAVAIDEAGLYSLVLRSKLPKAEAFQEWVVSEVLPSIRNTGGYSTKPVERGKSELNTKALAKALAVELKRQEMKALPPAGKHIAIRTDDAEKRKYIESVVAAMELLPAGYCACVETFARGLLR
ncbi:MAG: Bro-N domain-containing protein [Phascolarctobacterium sp.]|nr:Bro-N domain-containing protein [Phascolarctobacterium sp.]